MGSLGRFRTIRRAPKSGLVPVATGGNLNDEIDRATLQELAIRKFLEEKNILTVPASIRHYTLRPTPDYLAALEDFGELDDFTDRSIAG